MLLKKFFIFLNLVPVLCRVPNEDEVVVNNFNHHNESSSSSSSSQSSSSTSIFLNENLFSFISQLQAAQSNLNQIELLKNLFNVNQVLAKNNLAQFPFLNFIKQFQEQQQLNDSSENESSSSKLNILFSNNNESNNYNNPSKRNISQVLKEKEELVMSKSKQFKHDESTQKQP